MNITIIVPVHVDEPVTDAARDKLKKHLEAALNFPNQDVVRRNLANLVDTDARNLGCVCRFKFGKLEAKVE